MKQRRTAGALLATTLIPLAATACGANPTASSPTAEPPVATLPGTPAPLSTAAPTASPAPAPTAPQTTDTASTSSPDNPPAGIGLLASEGKALALVEGGGMSVDAEGRFPVLAELPPGFNGLDAVVVAQPETLGTYSIVYSAPSGSSVPVLASNLHSVSIVFSALRLDPGERADEQKALSDRTTVKVGNNEAWIGPSVTKDCGEPGKEGYNQRVLTWFRGDVVLSLDMNPIPECEPGALTLAQVIEVAEHVADCRGFRTGTPECRPAPGANP